MKRLRLARRALLALNVILVIPMVAALWTMSALSALLVGLAFLSLAGGWALTELSVHAEIRQRWRLKRDLERRISDLEALFNVDPGRQKADEGAPGAVRGYRHQAQLLHRLKSVERRLGMESHVDSQMHRSKDVTE